MQSSAKQKNIENTLAGLKEEIIFMIYGDENKCIKRLKYSWIHSNYKRTLYHLTVRSLTGIIIDAVDTVAI